MKKNKQKLKVIIPTILSLTFIILLLIVVFKIKGLKLPIEKGYAEAFFTSAILDDVDVSNLVISKNKRSIDFNTKELSKLGESSVLSYKLKNNSKEYNAKVVVNCSLPADDIYEITNNTKDEVKNQGTSSGEVIITITKELKDKSTQINCHLSIKPIEKN